MADSWSGFIAYTYDGPKDFVMFDGGPWNGNDVLTPTKDFENFKHQLKKVSRRGTNITLDQFDDGRFVPNRCDDVQTELLSCCGVRLFDGEKMSSFAHMIDVHTGREVNSNVWLTMAAFVFALGATFWIHKSYRAKRNAAEGISLLNGNAIENAKYKSVSS
jgi:hypothetical protein